MIRQMTCAAAWDDTCSKILSCLNFFILKFL